MRETGPAAKVYISDQGNSAEAQRLAAPYIGPARTLLGVLKHDMGFSGLQQGQAFKDFPDGTRIIAESRFGQDKFTITTAPQLSPVPSPAEPPPPELPEPPPVREPHIPSEIEGFQVVVAGTCGPGFGDAPATGAVFRPWIWTPGKGTVEIPMMAGIRAAWVNAISANGQVVVGTWRNALEIEGSWRWDAVRGMQDLGNLGYPESSEAGATGANADGSVIVGHDRDTLGFSRAWVWTEADGMRVLPDSIGLPACISPNGKWIAGSCSVPVQDYQYTAHGPDPVTLDSVITAGAGGMRWQLDNGRISAGQPMPVSGSIQGHHTAYFGTLPITWYTPIQITPAAIADDGTVAGAGWAALLLSPENQITNMYDPGSTPAPDETVNNSSSNPLGRVTRGIAGLSADRNVSAINLVEAPADRAYFYRRGQALSRIEHDVAVYAMALTGQHFTGGTGGFQFMYDFNLRRTTPVYWDHRGMQQIDLLPGTVTGWGAAIAAVSTRLPPVPPAPIPMILAN